MSENIYMVTDDEGESGNMRFNAFNLISERKRIKRLKVELDEAYAKQAMIENAIMKNPLFVRDKSTFIASDHFIIEICIDGDNLEVFEWRRGKCIH